MFSCLHKRLACLFHRMKNLLNRIKNCYQWLKILKMNGSLSSRNRLSITSKGRLSRYFWYFCSETMLKLSKKILTDTEIKILEKGFDFAPVQRKIKEPKLRKDFEGFCRRAKTKRYFWNEPYPDFSNTPYVKSNSNWRYCFWKLLSKVENELFEITD